MWNLHSEVVRLPLNGHELPQEALISPWSLRQVALVSCLQALLLDCPIYRRNPLERGDGEEASFPRRTARGCCPGSVRPDLCRRASCRTEGRGRPPTSGLPAGQRQECGVRGRRQMGGFVGLRCVAHRWRGFLWRLLCGGRRHRARARRPPPLCRRLGAACYLANVSGARAAAWGKRRRARRRRRRQGECLLNGSDQRCPLTVRRALGSSDVSPVPEPSVPTLTLAVCRFLVIKKLCD